MKQRPHLQRHRIQAMSETLMQLSTRLNKKIDFLEEFAEVYKWPKSIRKRNIRKYRKWLNAARELADLEFRDIA